MSYQAGRVYMQHEPNLETFVTFRDLPEILKNIKNQKSDGKLLINKANQQAVLFFSGGNLVDARTADSEGDEVLYRILNWKEARLAWESGSWETQQTLDSQQANDFWNAVLQLSERGNFSQAVVEPAVLERFFAPVALPPTETNASVGYRLPVPTGKPFNLLPDTDKLEQLLERLQQNHFTGYLQFSPNAELEKNLVVVFEDGEATAAAVSQSNPTEPIFGSAAWQLFQEYATIPDYNLMFVSAEIIAAYRALLTGYQPYKNVTATLANYRGLLSTFKRGQHSGILQFKLEQTELYDFIYEGQEIGTFSREIGTPYLRPATASLALLLDNPATCVDVFVARPEILSRPTAPISQLTNSEAGTLAGTLAVTIGLLSNLLTQPAALKRLREVAQQIAGQAGYRFFDGLAQLELANSEPDDQAILISRWLTNQTQTPRESLLQAFEQLFEQYLQPVCLRVGTNTFHEMIVRALGPVRAEALRKLGLQVDFFDRVPETAAKQSNLIIDENPYDF